MRKRANGEGSIRKRSNGTWEARVTVGVNPETGKLISKSVYGRTQKEVREKLKDWRISQQKPASGGVVGGVTPGFGYTGGSTGDDGFVGVREEPSDVSTKRVELADKIRMIPSGEIKEIISEIIEKEDGYILDVLLKYVQ